MIGQYASDHPIFWILRRMWPWYNGEITVQLIRLADTILTIWSCGFFDSDHPILWILRFWLIEKRAMASWWTRLDWLLRVSCPGRTLLIGCLRLAILRNARLDMQNAWQENDYANGVFLRWQLHNNPPLWPVLRQTGTNKTSPYDYILYPSGVILLCTMLLLEELGKCPL